MKKSVLYIVLAAIFVGMMVCVALAYPILAEKFEKSQEEAQNTSSEVVSSEVASAGDTSSTVTSDTKTSSAPTTSKTTSTASKAPVSSQKDTSSEAPTVSRAPVSSNPTADFTVYDMNGKAHKLSEFFGYPIVVNCWASWCTPCKKELPYFDYAYSQYKDKGVIFLMVDMVDGSPTEAGKAKQIVSDNGYSFPIYFDNDNSLKEAYGVTSIPRTLLIKANGELLTTLRGTQTEASVMNAIKNLIG